ncbi:MAG: hypothetical protein H6936_09450 [Burkholderiales bacterium]|nr:hypothetical protein [Nitrosomonas sp.]MCP5275058.1 hypothetical protein [Burkholderiales bacterium]
MKYKVISRLDHNNVRYEPGEEIGLSQSEARKLLEGGVIERIIKPFSGGQQGSSAVN